MILMVTVFLLFNYIIRGIGKITAAVLISIMPELGKTNGKRIRRWRDLPRTRATAVS